jgi:hypothetical protein
LDLLRLGKLRNAVREKHFFLAHDNDMSKDFMFSLSFDSGDYCLVRMQCATCLNQWVGDELSDICMRIPPPTTNLFDGFK